MQTLLHFVAENGNLEIVKYPISKGAEKKYCGSYTSLHLTAKSGHIKVVKYLIERGADLTIKNN